MRCEVILYGYERIALMDLSYQVITFRHFNVLKIASKGEYDHHANDIH